MDAEDAMHDANDLESLDDFYSGDTAMDSDNDDVADYGYMENDSDDDFETLSANRQQKNYFILKEEDIRQRQEDDIARISAHLSISRVATCVLLHHYKWSVNNVHEAWFADEDRVRKAVGPVDKPVVKFPNLTCGICFETYPAVKINSAACGHPYCCTCWAAYISTSINDGPGCLTLRCPDPSCGAAVGQDMINKLVSNEDKEKYDLYLLRSYIEDNRKLRQKALADLHQMQTVHLEKLGEKQKQPESQLKFVIEAWLQIVECRLVLKWTYAYGFYLPEHEHAKGQFFEYLQGEAEANLERLHQRVEKELQNYPADGTADEFNNFCTKLAGLTSVTQNYFENLVRALENGLSDVDSL